MPVPLTQTQRISALGLSVATQIKLIRATIGSLSDLTTASKSSIVASLNGLQADLTALSQTASGIDDSSTSLSKTWSSSKTNSAITMAVANLINGAPAAMDTLKELSDALAGENDQIIALLTAVGNRVRFDAAQILTSGQQAQARANIGALSIVEIGDPDHDYAAEFAAALQ